MTDEITIPTAAELRHGLRERVAELERRLAEMQDAHDRLLAERDALIAAWPEDHGTNDGPVLYRGADGRWWLETVGGDRWKRAGGSGPFPSREAAVRAAAGIGIGGGAEEGGESRDTQALAVLRDIEWLGVHYGNMDDLGPGCPECHGSRESGHAPDCRLAAVLAKATGEGGTNR